MRCVLLAVRNVRLRCTRAHDELTGGHWRVVDARSHKTVGVVVDDGAVVAHGRHARRDAQLALLVTVAPTLRGMAV